MSDFPTIISSFDIETVSTGGSPSTSDPILSIAVEKLDRSRPVGSRTPRSIVRSWHIKSPDPNYVPFHIKDIQDPEARARATKRYNRVQAKARTPKEVLPEVFNYMKGTTLGGYNSRQFDIPALINFAEKNDVAVPKWLRDVNTQGTSLDLLDNVRAEFSGGVVNVPRTQSWAIDRVLPESGLPESRQKFHRKLLASAHAETADVIGMRVLWDRYYPTMDAITETIASKTNIPVEETIEELSFMGKNKGLKYGMIGIGIGAAFIGAYMLFGDSAGEPNRIQGFHTKTEGVKKEWHSPWAGPTVSGPLSQMMARDREIGFSQHQQVGPHPNDPHPELSPPTPKDSYRFQKMAPSSIGLSYWEMYNYMTQPDRPSSEHVQASASAGTALHRYLEAQALASGKAAEVEKLLVDPVLGIAGYADIITPSGAVGDIKSLSAGRFKAVQERGWAYPSHMAQVRLYQAMLGSVDEPGFITYVNRDDISQEMHFPVPWSASSYNEDIKRLQSVRRRVLSDLDSGKINLSDMPRASSIEALEEEYEQVQKETSSLVSRQSELKQTYIDQMEWLNSTRRNMPDYLIDRNKKSYNHDSVKYKEKDRAWMGQTVGLGQHLFNNANKHYLY